MRVGRQDSALHDRAGRPRRDGWKSPTSRRVVVGGCQNSIVQCKGNRSHCPLVLQWGAEGPAVVCVPNAHHVVVTACSDIALARPKSGTYDDVLMLKWWRQRLAGSRIPDSCSSVAASGE